LGATQPYSVRCPRTALDGPQSRTRIGQSQRPRNLRRSSHRGLRGVTACVWRARWTGAAAGAFPQHQRSRRLTRPERLTAVVIGIGKGIARPLALAIRIRIEKSAIAGLRHHWLRRRRRCEDGRRNGGPGKKLESRHCISPVERLGAPAIGRITPLLIQSRGITPP
jgi:hypothetical protein